jgi:hypothetical protein
LVTLREAIVAANTNATTDLGQTGSGADIISFAPSVSGTISLTFGEMVISDSLTINGRGRDVLTIDAQQNSRIFNITAASGNFNPATDSIEIVLYVRDSDIRDTARSSLQRGGISRTTTRSRSNIKPRHVCD